MDEMIDLKPEEVTKEFFDTAQFVSYAWSGAMGDSGAVIVVSDEGKSYYCNYVYGDVPYETISKAFPIIECYSHELPDNWKNYDMGMGNILFVRKEHLKEFEALTKGKFLYHHWYEAAIRICRPE